jgi:hypothetical protein
MIITENASHNTPIPNIPSDVTPLARQAPRHFFR